jgi:RNA polymerase sigma factor (sigma-70 family)
MGRSQPFLELLDSDPLRAAELFYAYAMNYFRVVSPKYLTLFRPDDREDIKHEICLHCIKDQFRVLRQYHQTDSEFSAWFHVTAHNRAMDILKAQNRRPKFSRFHSDSHEAADSLVNTAPGPDRNLESNERLKLVNKILVEMNRYCQLLLRLSGDEFTPMEITRILRWPSQKSKKVATDVSYCRETLRRKFLSQIGEPEYGKR